MLCCVVLCCTVQHCFILAHLCRNRVSSYTLSLNKLQSTFKVNAISTSRKISGCRVQVYERPHNMRKRVCRWENEKEKTIYSSNTDIYTRKAILFSVFVLRSEKKMHLKTNFCRIVYSRMMRKKEWTNERTNGSVCQEMSVLWLVAVAIAVEVEVGVVATVVMVGII